MAETDDCRREGVSDASEHLQNPKYPLIIFHAPHGDDRTTTAFFDSCARQFPGYLVDRRQWLFDASPAVARVLHSQAPPRSNPLFAQALEEQRKKQPVLALVLGETTDEVTRKLFAAADRIIILDPRSQATEQSPALQTEHTLRVSVQDPGAEIAVVDAIRQTMQGVRWPSTPEAAAAETSRVDIATLAEEISVPSQSFPDGGKRYNWGITHVQPALLLLRDRLLGSKKPIHIDGVCPAFLACAIASAFPGRHITLSDPKVKDPVAIPDNLSVTSSPRETLLFSSEEREEYTFLDVSIPTSGTGEQPWFALTDAHIREIELPTINRNKGVVLSGKLPLVLFTTLCRSFQQHGVAWVAILTPQQTRDARMLSPAMKVCGGDIEYINVFPYYIETFPIDAIEKTIASIQRELGEAEDPLYENLKVRLRAKYEMVRQGVALQRDNEQLFHLYAELIAAAHMVVRGLGELFNRHGITEKEATRQLFVEALTILTEDTGDEARVSAVRRKIATMQADIVAFGTIVRQVYSLSGRTMDIGEVPQLRFQRIGIRSGAPDRPTDPGQLLDQQDAPSLWQTMQRIYRENHEDDPQFANRLIEQFPRYLQENLHPSLYVLSFAMQPEDPKRLVGFVRCTDLEPEPPDGKRYRYVGGLNFDRRFQGYQLLQPFMRTCLFQEFNDYQCDALVLRAEPRIAKAYERMLGARATNQTFTGEYPSGKASVLMIVTRETFMREQGPYLTPPPPSPSQS